MMLLYKAILHLCYFIKEMHAAVLLAEGENPGKNMVAGVLLEGLSLFTL